MKRHGLNLLKLGVGIGFVWWLLQSGEINFSELSVVKERWHTFALAQVLCGIAFFATLIRWKLVLRALEVPSQFSDVIRLGWIGLLFSQIIPGSTGGDLVKGIYVARETPERRAEAVLSVVLDRIVGLTALMLLGGIALVLNRDLVAGNEVLTRLAWALGTVICCVFVGGALISWRAFWQQRWLVRMVRRLPGHQLLERLAGALWTVRGKRKLLFVSLIMSVVIHALNVSWQYLLACSFMTDLGDGSYLAFFFIIPIGQLAFALPVSPGGLGVGEWAYHELFNLVQLPSGFNLAVLARITVLMWASVGLYFYIRGKKELKIALQEAEDYSEGVPAPAEPPPTNDNPERERVVATE